MVQTENPTAGRAERSRSLWTACKTRARLLLKRATLDEAGNPTREGRNPLALAMGRTSTAAKRPPHQVDQSVQIEGFANHLKGVNSRVCYLAQLTHIGGGQDDGEVEHSRCLAYAPKKRPVFIIGDIQFPDD